MKKRFTLIALGGMAAAVAVLVATGSSGGANVPKRPPVPTNVGPEIPLAIRANDTTILTVWRNGEYHEVTIHLKRKVQNTSDGGRTEIVSPADDTAAIEAQLPPVDHRLDGVTPTAAQATQAQANLALPPPPGAGTQHMLPVGSPESNAALSTPPG